LIVLALAMKQQIRRMVMQRVSIILCVLLTLPSTALAFCFEEAGQQYGISPAILWTIAKEESNFDHTAVNLNKNGTYDFGLMQINSWWANILGPETWSELGEPCYNVKVGAWILSRCIQEHGRTWEAIGCYHSRGERRKKKYAWMIYDSLIKHIPGYSSIHSVR
jgi:soluble lytic murein transglycosylase-like protein